MLKVSTYFGLFLIFLSRLSACKFHLNSQLEGQKTLRSLINILQTPPHGDTVTQAYTTNTMGTISTRSSRKIENKSQLTYKNLNMKMIQTLRRRLNALPPLRNEPWDVRLPSAGVQTVCKFLPGYQFPRSGRCTEVTSCIAGDLEYRNTVSIDWLCWLQSVSSTAD